MLIFQIKDLNWGYQPLLPSLPSFTLRPSLFPLCPLHPTFTLMFTKNSPLKTDNSI